MAKETKFVKVEPSKVESTIELWQNFGWEMMDAPQEIFNRDARYVKEIINYVKITFQRDNSMPHYVDVCDLERQYHSIRTIDIPVKTHPIKKTVSIPTGWFEKGEWGDVLFSSLGGILFIIGVLIWWWEDFVHSLVYGHL
jgi:hypothetical protein